jgi:serine protease
MNAVNVCYRACWLMAMLLWGATAAAQGESKPLAYGLLVQLKPEAAQDTQREASLRVRERLTSVFQGKSLPMGIAQPTGATAQWVRWARPLAHEEAQRLMEELRSHPDVQWVAPNVREKPLQAIVPNDTFYAQQWWLSASPAAGSRGVPDIAQAWQTWAPTSQTAVNVAVLDTGLLRTHPDLLGGRFASGYDLVADEDGLAGDGDGRDADFSDPGDGVAAGVCGIGAPAENSSWHGTRIAGQIGALVNNSLGVSGINWTSRVVTVRVASKCGALVSDILDGMRWAAGMQVGTLPVNTTPVRVINLSFGSDNTDCTPYQSTINQLRTLGVLVIAAAGNDDGVTSTAAVNRPARCPGVMAVGSVNRDGFKATYSSLGPQVSITTVGGDPANQGSLGAQVGDGGIVSTTNDGTLSPGVDTYTPASYGTSFSTPVVAGVASLMLSINPNLTLDELAFGLQTTARPHISTSAFPQLQACQAGVSSGRCYCTTTTCGAGLLDAPAALAYAQNPALSGSAPVFGGSATTTPPASSGGGGGALGAGWLLALALAVAALQRTTRGVQH